MNFILFSDPVTFIKNYVDTLSPYYFIFDFIVFGVCLFGLWFHKRHLKWNSYLNILCIGYIVTPLMLVFSFMQEANDYALGCEALKNVPYCIVFDGEEVSSVSPGAPELLCEKEDQAWWRVKGYVKPEAYSVVKVTVKQPGAKCEEVYYGEIEDPLPNYDVRFLKPEKGSKITVSFQNES